MIDELTQAERDHAAALKQHEAARNAEAAASRDATAARERADGTKAAHQTAIAKADALIASAACGENVSARDLVAARAAADEPAALVELHQAAAARAASMHRAATEALRAAGRELEGRADVLRHHRRIAAAKRLDAAMAEAEKAVADLAELGPHHARRYYAHLGDHPTRTASTETMDVRVKLGGAEKAERLTPMPRVIAA